MALQEDFNQIIDLYKSVTDEKENPYSYEHELAVQRTLCRVVGEN